MVLLDVDGMSYLLTLFFSLPPSLHPSLPPSQMGYSTRVLDLLKIVHDKSA